MSNIANIYRTTSSRNGNTVLKKKKKMEPARTIRLFVEQCVFVRLLQLLRRKTGFLENAQCKSERVQVARPAAGQQRNINC